MHEYVRKKKRTDVGTRWIHRRSHSIGKKIVLPTKGLHKKHPSKTVDGSLLEDLMIVGNVSAGLRGKIVVSTRSGNEVLVALDGHGSLVMGMMGGAPGIIGNQDELWDCERKGKYNKGKDIRCACYTR